MCLNWRWVLIMNPTELKLGEKKMPFFDGSKEVLCIFGYFYLQMCKTLTCTFPLVMINMFCDCHCNSVTSINITWVITWGYLLSYRIQDSLGSLLHVTLAHSWIMVHLIASYLIRHHHHHNVMSLVIMMRNALCMLWSYRKALGGNLLWRLYQKFHLLLLGCWVFWVWNSPWRWQRERFKRQKESKKNGFVSHTITNCRNTLLCGQDLGLI